MPPKAGRPTPVLYLYRAYGAPYKENPVQSNNPRHLNLFKHFFVTVTVIRFNLSKTLHFPHGAHYVSYDSKNE